MVISGSFLAEIPLKWATDDHFQRASLRLDLFESAMTGELAKSLQIFGAGHQGAHAAKDMYQFDAGGNSRANQGATLIPMGLVWGGEILI